jgi:hypothetical protein
MRHDYKELIKKNAISMNTALRVANSQVDLGGLSKKDMIKCLTFESSLDVRIESFEKLDLLSQFIVIQILSSNLHSFQYFDYSIDNIQKARLALNND